MEPIVHLFEFLKWIFAAVFIPAAGIVYRAFHNQGKDIKAVETTAADNVKRLEDKVDSLHMVINNHAKEVAEIYARRADMDRFSERIEDKMDSLQKAVTERIDNLQSTLLPIISKIKE